MLLQQAFIYLEGLFSPKKHLLLLSYPEGRKGDGRSHEEEGAEASSPRLDLPLPPPPSNFDLIPGNRQKT